MTNNFMIETDENYYTIGDSLNKKKYSRVTKIIQSVFNDYVGISKQKLEKAAKRGTAIHKTIELYEKKILDFDNVDENLLIRLEAWKRFKKEYKINVKEVEKTIVSNRFGYAGTIDIVAISPMFNNGYDFVIDVKSCDLNKKSYNLQTAAYSMAYAEYFNRGVPGRMLVQLKDDGNYKIKKHENFQKDKRAFLCALELYNYKKEIN